MCVISAYVLLASRMDMYEFVEGISNRILWGIIFCYSILCSLFIDFIIKRIPSTSFAIGIILYIVAGYGIFIINGINIYMMIAGTVGAICSLLYYLGTYLASRFKSFIYLFSFVLPLILIILVNIDFTEKEQWIEVIEEHAYSATFDFFNGKHEIPIHAKTGQSLTLTYTFTSMNGGGHGFHVLNEKNEFVGLTELDENVMKFTVPVTGVYRIVITGDDVKGNFNVTWKKQ